MAVERGEEGGGGGCCFVFVVLGRVGAARLRHALQRQEQEARRAGGGAALRTIAVVVDIGGCERCAVLPSFRPGPPQGRNSIDEVWFVDMLEKQILIPFWF